MKTSHTPGPWYYGIAYHDECGAQPLSYRGPGYYDNAGILSANGTTVVGCDEYDIFGPMLNTDEREANCRLIAAAPDLLAALQWIATQSQSAHFEEQSAQCREVARAAIRKATE